MDIGQVEVARIAVGLIRNDAASVRRMPDQVRTKVCQWIELTGAFGPTHRIKHHEYATEPLCEGRKRGRQEAP